MIDSEIKQSIADNLNIADLSEDELGQVISRLEQNILKRVHLRVATTLSAEQNDQLIELINIEDYQAVRDFLLKHIPDLYEQVAEIAKQAISELKKLKS